MQQSNLSTSINSGSQGSTKSPQSGTNSAFNNNISTKSIQSGNASTFLYSNHNGIKLSPTNISSINLKNLPAGTQAQSIPTSSGSRHINPGLLMVAVVLFAFAIWLFYETSKSSTTAKATTAKATKKKK